VQGIAGLVTKPLHLESSIRVAGNSEVKPQYVEGDATPPMAYSLQGSLNLGFSQFSTHDVSQSNVKPQLLKWMALGLTAAGAPLRGPVEHVSTIIQLNSVTVLQGRSQSLEFWLSPTCNASNSCIKPQLWLQW
jgi:hypothetical protein